MTSVHFSSGNDMRSTTLPTLTGDFNCGAWIRCNAGEFGGGTEHVPFYLGRGGASAGNEGGIAIDVGATNNTTISALAYTAAGGPTIFDVFTGSFTGWAFYAFEHAAGSATYTIRWRKENEPVFQSHAIVNAAQFTANTSPQFDLGNDHAGEHALDSDIRHAYCQQSLLTDKQLLLLSQQIYDDPTGSNLHYLRLISGPQANVNRGTSANWTITGALLTTATEPSESLNQSPLTISGRMPAPSRK